MAINSAEELARYGYLSGAGFGESLANAFVGPSGYFPIVQKARDAYRSAQMEADRIGLEADRVKMLQDEYNTRKAEKTDAAEMNKIVAQGMLSAGVPSAARPLVEKAAATGQDLSKFSGTISMFGDEAARKNAEMEEYGQAGPMEPGTPYASSGVKEKIAKGDEQEEANAPYVEEYKRLSGKEPTRKQMRTSNLAVTIQSLQTQKGSRTAEGDVEKEVETYKQLAAKEEIELPAGVDPKTYYLAAKANKTAEGSGKTLYVNLKDPSKLQSLTTDQAADPKSGLGKDWVTYAEWQTRTRPKEEKAGGEEGGIKLTENKEKLRASLMKQNGAVNAILSGRPVTDFEGLPPAAASLLQSGRALTPEEKDMAIRQIRTLQAQTARELRNAPKTDPNESNDYPVPAFGDLTKAGPKGETIGITDPTSSDPDVPLRYGINGSGKYIATMVSPFGQHTLVDDTIDGLRKKALAFALQYPDSGYSVVKVNPMTGRVYNAAQTLMPAQTGR